MIALPGLPLLQVWDGDEEYCGGDQEWYAGKWQRQAGCGPTNCTNVIWYLAQTRESCKTLCSYDASKKANFVKLMDEVWYYVTPGHMGVNSTKIFAEGAEKFGQTKGVVLKANSLPIDPLHSGGRVYTQVEEFITKALESNLPVAFLNLSNGTLENLDSWHWVSIVALRASEAMIYDQGEARWIDLKRWLETSMMGGGFVVVEPVE